MPNDCKCGHDIEAHTHGNSGNESYPRIREWVEQCNVCYSCDDFTPTDTVKGGTNV